MSAAWAVIWPWLKANWKAVRIVIFAIAGAFVLYKAYGLIWRDGANTVITRTQNATIEGVDAARREREAKENELKTVPRNERIDRLP